MSSTQSRIAFRAVMVSGLLAAVTAAHARGQEIGVPPDSIGLRTWIGVGWNVPDPMIEPLEKRRPPVVRSVVPCSPAHYAGLEPGDLLLRVNGRDAREDDPFRGGEGTDYRVDVERGGKQLVVTFKRVQRPPERTPRPVTEAPVGSPADWNCPALVRLGRVSTVF